MSKRIMLRLSFKRLGLTSSLEALELEFRGSELFAGSHVTPIGRYAAGYWIYANERWPYAECRTTVIIRFEESGAQVGPIVGPRHRLELRDRFIYAGRERIATLLPNSGRWRLAGRDESWPIMKVHPYRAS